MRVLPKMRIHRYEQITIDVVWYVLVTVLFYPCNHFRAFPEFKKIVLKREPATCLRKAALQDCAESTTPSYLQSKLSACHASPSPSSHPPANQSWVHTGAGGRWRVPTLLGVCQHTQQHRANEAAHASELRNHVSTTPNMIRVRGTHSVRLTG